MDQAPRYRRPNAAFQVPARRRAAGALVALGLEALLILVLLTLGARTIQMRDGKPIVSFDLSADTPNPVMPDANQAKASPGDREARPEEARTEDNADPAPVERQVPSTNAEPPSSSLVELSREDLAAADLRSLPSLSARPRSSASRSGPPAPEGSGDTPVVGSGPNGEKLYAAAWYREPYDSELRGYLSTAQGPGWGLIACRTVEEYRVDSCVALDEHPTGSRIARAVLAAAWQFRVQPPRVGGKLKVGEWVRIRIDYTERK